MILRKQTLPFILFLVCSLHLTAQDTWQKILGGSYTDQGNSILLTSDGNLLIGGSSESFVNYDDREAYLSKLTPNGQVLWEKTFNTGSFWNTVNAMVETPESNYVATGKTWSGLCSSGQAFGFECSSSGNLNWMKGFCHPDAKLTEAYSAALAPDGSYVFCGMGLGLTNHSIATFKTDAEGNMQWAKLLGPQGWQNGNEVIVTKDGNIVVAAYWSVEVNGVTDAFIVKHSFQTGDTLWTTRIEHPGYERFQDVIELADSTLILLGSKDDHIWLSHFSANGQLINEAFLFPTLNTVSNPQQIIPTIDGGYAVLCTVRDSLNMINPDALLVKLSSNWTVQWTQQYGGPLDDYMYEVVQTPEGCYYMAGTSECFGDTNGDIWVVKTDSLGKTTPRIIRGKVYIDDNLNCLEEPGETAFPNVRLTVSDGTENILRLSDASGNYSSLPIPGNYNISADVNPPYWDFCLNPQSAIVTNITTEVVRDFAAQSIVECPYISVDVSLPWVRHCGHNVLYAQICNSGSAIAPNTQVRIELDPFLILDSATVAYAPLTGNTFLFDTDSLGLFECKSFLLYLSVDCAAPLGWYHCVNGYAFPDTLCHPGADTAFVAIEECAINVGSFDPNDKRAFPPGVGTEHWLAPDTEIKYQIRFQNTGTDTAFRVVIVDTLAVALDPMSFRTGAYSHPYRLEWLPGNIVRFLFDPIALPDSNANEPLSHGFVNFFIRPKPNLANGTLLNNSAAIYFDANAPVLTNTWQHTIGQAPVSKTIDLAEAVPVIYPNPANQEITVQIPEAFLNGRIEISDVLGRIQHTRMITGEQERLEISNLLPGMYRVSILSANASVFHTWMVVQH